MLRDSKATAGGSQHASDQHSPGGHSGIAVTHGGGGNGSASFAQLAQLAKSGSTTHLNQGFSFSFSPNNTRARLSPNPPPSRQLLAGAKSMPGGSPLALASPDPGSSNATSLPRVSSAFAPLSPTVATSANTSGAANNEPGSPQSRLTPKQSTRGSAVAARAQPPGAVDD